MKNIYFYCYMQNSLYISGRKTIISYERQDKTKNWYEYGKKKSTTQLNLFRRFPAYPRPASVDVIFYITKLIIDK